MPSVMIRAGGRSENLFPLVGIGHGLLIRNPWIGKLIYQNLEPPGTSRDDRPE